MSPSPRILTLTEYETLCLPPDALTETQARHLHASYSIQVGLSLPSFKNGNQWQLTPRGWVGTIPLDPTLHIHLAPKVPLSNLFHMLEYAYRLDFKILDGLTGAETIADVFERLAFILAMRVRARIRRGLHRSYVQKNDELPFLRGRIDVDAQLRTPCRVTIPCHFEDHTSDLEDNQILLWTLIRILQSGLCSERTLPQIRQAMRALAGFCSPKPILASQCRNRIYHRLNADYEPLHALCAFFLENTGPSHERGNHKMLPILVNMDRLFERFVAEWLKRHIPAPYVVNAQETMAFGTGWNLKIRIDMTITDPRSGKTCFVLDTKYKAPESPAPADVQQVVAYAEAKTCDQAVLLYPIPVRSTDPILWGTKITVRSLSFNLNDDLTQSGQDFLRDLMSTPAETASSKSTDFKNP